ncbi:16S rRNA m(2)G 1207 methyltransferase [Seinonella peptonophila]|uniref:16S rRNA m(2)G 1207 methyltransferase n=1 Tax=Seinonella peptonophila TaxID=112248 RepID=A0A1M4YW40_9BACL|nr:class I SAM-dependent methyltransferase [Seinonella peptonophila]SHF09546.1 16S rRNA m(2)G 1207 methyltransferase [Seinonella peptonophila]
MKEHYFKERPESESNQRIIQANLLGHPFSFITDSGVFSKQGVDFGSRFLIENVEVLPGDRVLDLGCGYGAIGISLRVHYSQLQMTMVDINERAVQLAKENWARHCLQENMKIMESDGFAQLQSDQRYDLIVTNPPIRAGKAVIYRWFRDSVSYLAPNGRLWVVIRKQQGAQSAVQELSHYYPIVDVVNRNKGYWLIRAVMN